MEAMVDAKKEMFFGDLEVGTTFETHDGVAFQKTEVELLPRYGYVNAKSLAKVFYVGDTGHRHFYNDQRVMV